MLGVLVLAWALVTGVTPPIGAEAETFSFRLEPAADGFDRPVQVVFPDDGSGRLIVVEQSGRLRVVQDGQTLSAPFLDITDRVGCCGERGLLSAAFHPDFAANGLVFVNYTNVEGDTVVARYRVSADDPNRLDAATEEIVLAIDQPASNHNGGLLLFGPRDGYLYVGLGDGGGGNSQHGQDLSSLLGAILRIDIDRAEGELPYAIPPDNPFVGSPAARPEIWVYGLRNPWRFSFDRATGDLWIGDVGSSLYEEVNLLPAASPGGANFGWDAMEGFTCRASGGCDGFVAPVGGFGRDEGCVVTGGYVYRGDMLPALAGVYLFADYCGGTVWGLQANDKAVWSPIGSMETGRQISSFGEDIDGELYIVDLAGAIYRIEAA